MSDTPETDEVDTKQRTTLGSWAVPYVNMRNHAYDLERRLSAAQAELAQIGSLRRVNAMRREKGRGELGIPCACEFDADDNQVNWCAVHAEMRRNLETAQADNERLKAEIARLDAELRFFVRESPQPLEGEK